MCFGLLWVTWCLRYWWSCRLVVVCAVARYAPACLYIYVLYPPVTVLVQGGEPLCSHPALPAQRGCKRSALCVDPRAGPGWLPGGVSSRLSSPRDAEARLEPCGRGGLLQKAPIRHAHTVVTANTLGLPCCPRVLSYAVVHVQGAGGGGSCLGCLCVCLVGQVVCKQDVPP